MGLFYGTCYSIKKVLSAHIKGKTRYKSWVVALLVGAIVYQLFNKIWDFVLYKIANLQACRPVDSMFLYDDKGNQSIVAVILNFQRFESGKVMKAYLQDKIEGLCKKIPNYYLRTRLHNVLGKWYWKYIEDDKEWAEMQDHLYVVNETHFTRKEDLEEYICRE